jgi:hypothetical protein
MEDRGSTFTNGISGTIAALFAASQAQLDIDAQNDANHPACEIAHRNRRAAIMACFGGTSDHGDPLDATAVAWLAGKGWIKS